MAAARKHVSRLLLPLLLIVAVLVACSNTERTNISTVRGEPLLAEDHALMDDGYRLPLAQWTPDGKAKAVVLALHGFNDYHNAFADVAPALAEQGVLTYAYDQRGFGATATRGHWSGAQRMVEDAQTVLELLRQRHPGLPIYLMGESMGGAVTIGALAEAGAPTVDGAILLAPAVWARQTMPWYQRVGLWVARQVAPDWKPTGKGLGRVASNNREALRALGRDPLVIKKTRISAVAGLANLMDLALASTPQLNVPTLILYGENDQIVPKLPTCRMLEQLPDDGRWQLGLYPDGYHLLTRDLQGQQVVADIASWIQGPRAALPSGHQAERFDWQQRVCGRASA